MVSNSNRSGSAPSVSERRGGKGPATDIRSGYVRENEKTTETVVVKPTTKLVIRDGRVVAVPRDAPLN